MARDDVGLVVLDELNIALRYDYLPLDEVVETLAARRPDLHVVVTGRNAKGPLIEAAGPRHRNDAGQAPLRRRGEGAGGYRILMAARAIMFQGTGSHVGKSVLVAGVARALANRAIPSVRSNPRTCRTMQPWRATAGKSAARKRWQARAARVAPSVHMNPVLLKPSSDVGAQIVVQGKVRGAARAKEFQTIKSGLMPRVLASFDTVRSAATLSSSRAPAALLKPTCGTPTSQTWGSQPRRTFRSS